MRSGMIAFSMGVIAVGYCRELPGTGYMILLLAVNTLACVFLRNSNRHGLAVALGCSLMLLTGATWHIVKANQRLQQRLPFPMEGVDFQVIGYVASLPETRDIAQQFEFFIESSPGGFEQRKILLNYYGTQEINAAQRWQFKVRLNRPHGFANPGSFDYEAWLLQQGISGKGYVRDSPVNQLLGIRKWSLLAFRGSLRDRIIAATEGLPQQPAILALAMGDRSFISDQQWQIFSRTGTNHLIVVSGLHIAMVASLCYLVGWWWWRLSTRLMLRFPAQKAGSVAALAGALTYSMLAGFSLPTQRAMVMVAVFMFARLLARRQNPAFSLLLSMVVVLLLDPFAAISAGFWLSFTAVGALLLVFAGMTPNTDRSLATRVWRNWTGAQIVVFVALLVPLSTWMGQFSLVSPIANSIAIPLVSWLVVPICLLATALVSMVPEVGSWLFQVADSLLGYLLQALAWFAAGEGIPRTFSAFPDSWLILMFASGGCLLLLLPWFAGNRLLGLLLLMPLLMPVESPSGENTLELHVLDVGQGLAVIIRTRSHVLVYDTGARFGDGFDSGTAIVSPVLKSMGVNRIDRLIVSHGDNDHAGGVTGLLQQFPVDSLISSEPELAIPPGLMLKPRPCKAGQQWHWDSVQFQFLHPATVAGLSRNNRSCVLQLSGAGHSILLPGDIEAKIERQLVRQQAKNLRSDIVVAAHHGSNTSSTADFVGAIKPGIVIFSAGYRSQFGHPTDKVRDRFLAAGAEPINTADSGMISIYLNAGELPIRTQRYRNQQRRYWY